MPVQLTFQRQQAKGRIPMARQAAARYRARRDGEHSLHQGFVVLVTSNLPETMPCKATSTTTLRRFSNAVHLY